MITWKQIKITPKVSIGEGTSRDKSGQVELDAQKEVEDLNRTATREELQAGQLPATEILSLPMFKVRYTLIWQVLS